MKRWIQAGLILTSLFGYTEWGKGYHAFVFQMEYFLLSPKGMNAENYQHPLVLIPLAGQLLLIAALLFQKLPNWITTAGMIAIGIFLWLLLFIGVIDLNPRITAAALPYLICCGLWIYYLIRLRTAQKSCSKNQ